MKDILDVVKEVHSTVTDLSDALKNYPSLDNQTVNQVLCSSRGMHCLEKMRIIIETYQPTVIASNTVFKILTWYLQCIDVQTSFSTISLKDKMILNQRINREIQ